MLALPMADKMYKGTDGRATLRSLVHEENAPSTAATDPDWNRQREGDISKFGYLATLAFFSGSRAALSSRRGPSLEPCRLDRVRSSHARPASLAPGQVELRPDGQVMIKDDCAKP